MKSGFRAFGWIGVGVMLCVVSSCSHQPPRFLGKAVGNPIAIHLHVSAEAGETDELGGTAAIIDAVSAGLDERGLRYKLYTSDEDRPHPPLIDIRVERWNPGDRTLHGAAEGAGFASPIAQAAMSAASAGGFVVFSRLVQEGEQEPRAIFMYSGSLSGSSPSVSVNTGGRVGGSIISDAFRPNDTGAIGKCVSQRCN